MRHSRDIDMRYNAQLGSWYNPLSWFASGESSTGTALSTSSASSQGSDDLFAPGEEQKMTEQLIREDVEAEYRKKLMMLAFGCAIGLVVAVWFRSQAKKPKLGG